MKLVLYSGYDEDNSSIDQALVKLVGKTSPRVTFIPSAHHVPEHEYQYFCETFRDYGYFNIQIFNVDQPFSTSQADYAFQADLVYLSGGNTFYFLNAIRKQGFDVRLKAFINRGGVLAGLSAGAIIMTPTIATASYPKFDRDHNEVRIKNLDSLSLVEFEFFPHYQPDEAYAKELRRQSKKISHPIFGVDDGGGIIVDDQCIRFYGDVWGYVDGKEFLVHRKPQ